MNEGYVALLIAIFREITPEQAFMVLDGKNPKAKVNNHKWTDSEFEEIAIYREEGVSWRRIGEMFGMRGMTVHTAYKSKW
ncbi:MAG: hypothetical protein ACI4LK_06510 [Lentihominibacter sp.]